MILYLARHGQSEANVLREFSNRTTRHGLTELGRAQAEALAERMSSLAVTAIYSSPILRAVQTAEIVGKRLGLHFEITPALSEFDVGVWEGRKDAEGWQSHADTVRAWLVEGRTDARMQGGESLEDIKKRFLPFIHGLVQNGNQPDSILLIGHGGTYLSMLPVLTKDITPQQAFETRYPNTAVISLKWDGDSFHLISVE